MAKAPLRRKLSRSLATVRGYPWGSGKVRRPAVYPAAKGHSKPKPHDKEAGNPLLPNPRTRPLHNPGADAAGSWLRFLLEMMRGVS